MSELLLSYEIRCILESCTFAWMFYTLAQMNINKHKYWIMVAIRFTLMNFMLYAPITFGVHTLIVVMILTISNILINRMTPYEAVYSTFGAYAIALACKYTNVFFVENVLHIEIVESQPIWCNILKAPSLIMSIMTVILMNALSNKFKTK